MREEKRLPIFVSEKAKVTLNNGKFGLRIYKNINTHTLRYEKHKAILKVGDAYFHTPNQEAMSKAVASLYKAVDNPEDLLLERPNDQGALHTFSHAHTH